MDPGQTVTANADGVSPLPVAMKALTQIYEESFENLRHLIECKICVKPMYEPYTISCGHTFCYSCLSQWFDTHRHNITCPECRGRVKEQPAPSFLVREMTRMFVSRAELMPAGETTTEHEKAQEEEASLVEKDRLNHTTRGCGLFRGCFANRFPPRPAVIWDLEDGVTRCPTCAWELEDGVCLSCRRGDGSADDAEFSEITDIGDSSDEGFPYAFRSSTDSRIAPWHDLSGPLARRIPTRRRLSSSDESEISDGIETDLEGFIEFDGSLNGLEDGPGDEDTEIDFRATDERGSSRSETVTISSNSEEEEDVPDDTEHEASPAAFASRAWLTGPSLSGTRPRPNHAHGRNVGSNAVVVADYGSSDETHGDSGSDVQILVDPRGSRKRRRVVLDDSDEEDNGHGGTESPTINRSLTRKRRVRSAGDTPEPESEAEIESEASRIRREWHEESRIYHRSSSPQRATGCTRSSGRSRSPEY